MRDMRGATCIMRVWEIREYMCVSCGVCVSVWHNAGACAMDSGTLHVRVELFDWIFRISMTFLLNELYLNERKF